MKKPDSTTSQSKVIHFIFSRVPSGAFLNFCGTSCVEYANDNITIDCDLVDTITDSSFDFFDGDPTQTVCNVYNFHPYFLTEEDDDHDGPYFVDNALINSKYHTYCGSKWLEVIMD